MLNAKKLNHLEWLGSTAAGHSEAGSRLRRGLHASWTVLRLWTRRARERRELRDLLGRDARFFQDIGLPRATLHSEVRKWFWQP